MEINKIYQIDCLEGLRQLEDKSIKHILTSPPYNRKRNDKYKHYDDTKTDYFEWLCFVIDECLRVTNGFIFFNIQKNYYNKEDVFKLIGKYAAKIQEVIIWEKTNPMPASGNSITNAYEFFIILSDSPLKSNTTYTKNIIATSVNGDMTSTHKAVMKQDVADWIITQFTKEQDLILDCFMGIGTTAISCIKYNRNYLGFEISEDYVKICLKRLHQNTLFDVMQPLDVKQDGGNGLPPTDESVGIQPTIL